MDILNWLSSKEKVLSDRRTEIHQRLAEDDYLQVLGLKRDIPGVIHVTGTKGKGSTCGMLEQVLRKCGYKTGMFTSPHLFDVRERIQINGDPIEEDLFLHSLFWCTDRLKGIESEEIPFPGYFRFLTLVGLRVFREMETEAKILEVGIGGRYDPTNVVNKPVVCGISLVGLDHQGILGHTVELIAWEKGGILKSDVPGFTVRQSEAAMKTLRQCAREANTVLHETHPADFKNWSEMEGRELKGFQLENATLAVSLAKEFERQFWRQRPEIPHPVRCRMAQLEKGFLPAAYLQGVQAAELPGRAQIIQNPNDLKNLALYLDGAHTPESLEACVDWIRSEWQIQDDRHLDFLLFNCHRLRTPDVLLGRLFRRLQLYQLLPHHVLFAPPYAQRDSLLPIPGSMERLEWQTKQLTSWCTLSEKTSTPKPPVPLPSLKPYSLDLPDVKLRFPRASADVVPSLQHAMRWLGSVAWNHRHMHVRVLVTGSLYFVSDVLRCIKARDG